MGKQLFGTDGIRGVAGEYPLDPATVHAFGMALGHDSAARASGCRSADRHGHARIRAVDRRTGGRRAGAAGVRVRFAGVITTPGVAYLTRSGSFTAGVMISASHNPYQRQRHQGVRPYRVQTAGRRRSTSSSRRSSACARAACTPHRGRSGGRRELARALPGLPGVHRGGRFDGMRMVLDCGNGAAYRLAPELFRRLGAEVTPSARAQRPQYQSGLRRAARGAAARGGAGAAGADLGVAFDGDADRAIFVARQRADRGWRCRAADRGARPAGRRTVWTADRWWPR